MLTQESHQRTGPYLNLYELYEAELYVMLMQTRRALSGLLFLALLLPSLCAQDFKDVLREAEKGDASAMLEAGHAYANGKSVPINYAEAVKWYRRAAEQGLAAAQSNLGKVYDKGAIVTLDLEQAVKWFRKAADQGYAEAQFYLGHAHYNGRGAPYDNIEAYAWYNIAKANGYSAASTQLRRLERGAMTRDEVVQAQTRTTALIKEIESRNAASKK